VDVPADSFELTVHINLPKSVEDHLKAAEAYREQAAEANRARQRGGACGR
jgi:hypothetical protein